MDENNDLITEKHAKPLAAMLRKRKVYHEKKIEILRDVGEQLHVAGGLRLMNNVYIHIQQRTRAPLKTRQIFIDAWKSVHAWPKQRPLDTEYLPPHQQKRVNIFKMVLRKFHQL